MTARAAAKEVILPASLLYPFGVLKKINVHVRPEVLLHVVDPQRVQMTPAPLWTGTVPFFQGVGFQI